MPLLLLFLLLAPLSSAAKDLGELSVNLAGLSGGVSDPTNKIDEIDQFGLALFTGLDQQSICAGGLYRSDSPTNPYGRGLSIEGR